MKIGEVVVVHIEYLNIITKFYYILKKNKKVLHIKHSMDGQVNSALLFPPICKFFGGYGSLILIVFLDLEF